MLEARSATAKAVKSGSPQDHATAVMVHAEAAKTSSRSEDRAYHARMQAGHLLASKGKLGDISKWAEKKVGVTPRDAARVATSKADKASGAADKSSDYRMHAAAADAHREAAKAQSVAGNRDAAHWHEEHAEEHDQSWHDMHPMRGR
jgi:hypothetical protein